MIHLACFLEVSLRNNEPVTVAQLAEFDEVIDVRSEAEFAEDHIPGATNCPVLDNEERSRVGTLYKQVSAFDAKKLGAALVSENIAKHLRRTRWVSFRNPLPHHSVIPSNHLFAPNEFDLLHRTVASLFGLPASGLSRLRFLHENIDQEGSRNPLELI